MSSVVPDRTTSPSEDVVRKIADRESVDPLELPPLYESVDPEALDALVETGDRSGSVRKIEFVYNDYSVHVTGEGTVQIDEEVTSRRSSM